MAAAEELRRQGWLKDGSLQGASLGRANLQGVYLWEANLQGATLWRANLQGATLNDADLQEATLGWANLQGADLVNAEFDENTTLPHGTKWAPDTDMTRFIDPEHPDFWRPE